MSVSYYILPLIFTAFGILLFCSKKTLYDDFIDGAREGIESAVKLIPTLILLLCTVSFFTAGGASEWITVLLSPLCRRIGLPSELIPLLLVRPMSGSGANALAASLFEQVGADSFIGRAASVIMGSSDTILYIAAVYFGAVGVKHTRHTLPVAFAVMLFCIFFSCLLCRLL